MRAIPDCGISTTKLATMFCLFAVVHGGNVLAQSPAEAPRSVRGSESWGRVIEDERSIKIETELLEAVIAKNNPKQWMTGIEKGSFLDKRSGFRELGDGLMVVDWLLEAGSDAAYSDKILAVQNTPGIGRYLWHENETDPARKANAIALHGSTYRKRMVEGPQLCPWMKPVRPRRFAVPISSRSARPTSTNSPLQVAKPDRSGRNWSCFPRENDSSS